VLKIIKFDGNLTKFSSWDIFGPPCMVT